MAMIAIGATAAVAGAAAAAYASNQATSVGNRSNAIAQQNYQLQREMASTQEEMAKAGSVDAAGNVTQYVPGVGWVSKPTQQSANIINAGLNEQQLQLSHDAPQNRMQRDNTFNRGLRAGAAGDAILGSVDQGGQSLDNVRGLLVERNVANAMAGKNSAESRINMNSLRQGTGTQYVMSQLARDGMTDTRSAIANAEADANPEYIARKTARVNPAVNQFTALSNVADAPIGGAIAPSGLSDSLAAQLAARQSGSVAGLNSAMGLKAPQLATPNNNMPQAIGNLGAAGQGLWGALAQRNQTFTQQNYAPNTPAYQDRGAQIGDYPMINSGGGAQLGAFPIIGSGGSW